MSKCPIGPTFPLYVAYHHATLLPPFTSSRRPLTGDSIHQRVGHHLLQPQCCVALSHLTRESNRYKEVYFLYCDQSSSSKSAKLHTVAASNNIDHSTRSLCYCLFVPHISVCCSSCTSRSWRIAL